MTKKLKYEIIIKILKIIIKLLAKYIFKKYQYYLDKKLENSTFLVLIIVLLILLVGFCVPTEHNTTVFKKNNILELKNVDKTNSEKELFISGKKYILKLEESE